MAPTGTEARGGGHGPIVGVDHPVYPLAVHATHQNGPGPHHDSRQAIWQNKNAVDLLVHHGTTVVAIADGRISKVGPLHSQNDPHHKHDPGLQGQRVVLDIVDAHGNVINHVYYAHLSGIDQAIHVGAMVTTGQALGKSGTAGGVEHLHIAVEHGNVLTLDTAPLVAPEAPAKATGHPFNLHIPVPHLLAPHTESGPVQWHPTPLGSPEIPGGPFDFHTTPPAKHGGLHLDLPPVHLGSYGDLTPFSPPDVASGEPNPGNAERATDHSQRDPDDLGSDPAAQTEIAIGSEATLALGLHPPHGQKGDAEPAPHGVAPSPPTEPHLPTGMTGDQGTTVHAVPFEIHLGTGDDSDHSSDAEPHHPDAPGHDSTTPIHLPTPAAELHHPGASAPTDLHLPVPHLHIDQPGGVHSQGFPAEPGTGHHSEHSSAVEPHHADAPAHDFTTSFNLHLLTPAAELRHPEAPAAADRSEHSGPDFHLDPTFGHGSGTPFNLRLDPSAGDQDQSVHGFDLPLHPGADGGDGPHLGASPFNLHLDVSSLPSQPGVQGTSEHPGAAHDTVNGPPGALDNHSVDSQGAQLDQAHVADAAQVADVSQGGNG